MVATTIGYDADNRTESPLQISKSLPAITWVGSWKATLVVSKTLIQGVPA